MTAFAWIVGGGALMVTVSLIGGLVFLGNDRGLERAGPALVAFAAGSLIGGALFHLLPVALAGGTEPHGPLGWVALGLLAFFVLEQFLHHHHCRRASATCRRPVGYLVLLGDGLHNLLGGLAIGATFLQDVRAGMAAWLAAAAHEIPQELGDFGVLVHAGWTRRAALAMNLLSATTFLLGGFVAYAGADVIDPSVLLPFAAGNFLYIGAADLVPEINKPRELATAATHLAAFTGGLGLMFVLALSGLE
jgi:zinc and cadmium transporter